jgi:hypothetical protein
LCAELLDTAFTAEKPKTKSDPEPSLRTARPLLTIVCCLCGELLDTAFTAENRKPSLTLSRSPHYASN